ncbi:hypothetical protein FEM03_00115 [Phragmitibacter flavus]|uniref:Uncharacterized protein n=1 Tax=Phragmitibacter flavus TaxID=2576071 RepID=A0A5R8KLE1_9BACT|nr:hypothetical protein [Phragmitibacter flavus]TLD72519.1 hypothetical protein FEM03_00115 [Phragmitibacter flavus]
MPEVLRDRGAIAKFFIHIVQQLETEKFEMRSARFNGAPGLLILVEGVLVSAISIEVREGRIVAIFGHRNPDKLKEFLRGKAQ